MGDPELANEALIPYEADMGFGLDGYIYKPFSTLDVEGR